MPSHSEGLHTSTLTVSCLEIGASLPALHNPQTRHHAPASPFGATNSQRGPAWPWLGSFELPMGQIAWLGEMVHGEAYHIPQGPVGYPTRTLQQLQDSPSRADGLAAEQERAMLRTCIYMIIGAGQKLQMWVLHSLCCCSLASSMPHCGCCKPCIASRRPSSSAWAH